MPADEPELEIFARIESLASDTARLREFPVRHLPAVVDFLLRPDEYAPADRRFALSAILDRSGATLPLNFEEEEAGADLHYRVVVVLSRFIRYALVDDSTDEYLPAILQLRPSRTVMDERPPELPVYRRPRDIPAVFRRWLNAVLMALTDARATGVLFTDRATSESLLGYDFAREATLEQWCRVLDRYTYNRSLSEEEFWGELRRVNWMSDEERARSSISTLFQSAVDNDNLETFKALVHHFRSDFNFSVVIQRLVDADQPAFLRWLCDEYHLQEQLNDASAAPLFRSDNYLLENSAVRGYVKESERRPLFANADNDFGDIPRPRSPLLLDDADTESDDPPRPQTPLFDNADMEFEGPPRSQSPFSFDGARPGM